MKKAVIYARYSSDSQTEQSIEGQLRVCKEYAKNNNILVVDTYIDRAMTGTNDMRPDFQRMLRDSAKRQWEIVLVYKLDRFSRDKYETTIHKHTLKENGVKLLSAMENIPDSPEGIILESLLEGMNQYYSAELSQKVHRGLNESYRKGQYTGGPIIYGYDVVDKKNVINPEEGEIVREIFTKYSQGYTAVALAQDLKARGIRTKKGIYITDKKIYKILANTKYNGKIKHGNVVYDNIYPAIIDDVLWQKVQDIHRENQHAPGRKKEIFDFILSGKLVCGDCKRLMVGESGTSKSGNIYYYYSCLAKRRKQHPCKLKAVEKQWLEDTVINTTWSLLADKGVVRYIAETLTRLHEAESKKNTNIKSLETQRQNALKASQNLIAAIEQGIITEQTKIRLKELEAKIAGLDFDIEQERQRSYTFLTADKIESYLNAVICGDIQEMSVRKLIVKTFVREVILDNDSVTITYNFCDDYTKYKISPESIIQVKRQSLKKTADNKTLCSYKLPSLPPSETRLNPEGSSEFSFALFWLN
ncbi:MAG: recombinase family protein [Clostridia bacterium]|nr:recombinase family protein [Clostridia bacterium]